jgi:chromate transporter
VSEPRTRPAAGRAEIADLVRTFAYIGLNSFGGPAGQIAVMHRVLVDEKKWIDDRSFSHALNFCMMLPGPEATQLATYVGWLRRGTLGGLIAGGLFVLPGAACMIGLSAIYAACGGVGLVSGVLLGLKCAVVVLVAHALRRIGARVLKTRSAFVLAAAALVAQFLFGVPFPLIVGAAALIGLIGGRAAPGSFGPVLGKEAGEVSAPGPMPRFGRTCAVALGWLAVWLVPLGAMTLTLSREHVLSRQAELFSKAAVVTFGGAYAVLGYIGQRAGAENWLTPPDMVAGLALAETTPGPLILVGQFVAFVGAYRTAGGGGGLSPMLAGAAGAAVFLWATFVPCFLWIFVGAPYMERLRASRWAGAMLGAVSAAVVGVIAHLGIWLALHTLFGRVDERTLGPLRLPTPVGASFDPAACVLAMLAAGLMFGLKWPTGRTLLICAICGAAWILLGRAG